MALIVITVQDTPGGAVVSLASEPPMHLAMPPAGKAQEFVHMMLGALPVNAPDEPAPAEPAAEDVQFPM